MELNDINRVSFHVVRDHDASALYPLSSMFRISYNTNTHISPLFAYLAGLTVTQKQATMGMTVLSAVVLFYLLSHIFWWTMFTSGFLVGAHAAFRDASMHKDEEDRVDMVGDLSMNVEEESAFLNNNLGDEV